MANQKSFESTKIGFFRSIRGTLLLIFLAVALLPMMVVGFLTYTQAKNALETEATNKLVAVRDFKGHWITSYFEERLTDALVLSNDPTILAATQAFDQAVEKSMATLDTDEMGAMNHYRELYRNRPDLVDANDGSSYSAVHAQYHDLFREYLEHHEFHDLFLVEPHQGNIIYSVEKQDDFGTGLINGRYADSNLANLARNLITAENKNVTTLEDFAHYEASGEPDAFIGSPIFDGSELVGVLIFEVPVDEINAIMTNRAGMGDTGEAYLVGADKLMRSDSRFEGNTILQREIDTVASARALNGETGVEVINDYRGVPVLSAYEPLDIAGVEWAILAEVDEAEAFAATWEMMVAILIILGAGALIVGVIAIFVANAIAKPIQTVTESARKLAGQGLPLLTQSIQAVADGNLTRSFKLEPDYVDVRFRNEIGQMAQAFNQMNEMLDVVGQNFDKMLNNLRGLVGHVQEGAEQVADASQQLNVAAEQASQAGQQVAATSQQVADGTSQQTQSITEAAGNVDQMARAAEGIARGSQEQAQSVQKTSDLITDMADLVSQVDDVSKSVTEANTRVSRAARHGVESVNQTGQGMDIIRRRTATTAEKVKEMGVRSKEIGRIIETIDDIADKTDMLALNAAVEAARAGEHGRGFAVVADQVRKLSEDSKNSTRDIGALIERVQETINEAIASMDSTSAEVDNGSQLVSDTSQSLQDIMEAAESAALLAERIDQAVRQLKAKNEGVVSAIESVSAVVEENTAVAEEMAANSQEVTGAMENVSSIAEENSASTEEVSASAEEMSAQAEEVVASAEELSALAEELRAAISQFQVDSAQQQKMDEPTYVIEPTKPSSTPDTFDQPAEPALEQGNGHYRDSEPEKQE